LNQRASTISPSPTSNPHGRSGFNKENIPMSGSSKRGADSTSHLLGFSNSLGRVRHFSKDDFK
jgi:hypothetical protein